jgi:hypothetical protein
MVCPPACSSITGPYGLMEHNRKVFLALGFPFLVQFGARAGLLDLNIRVHAQRQDALSAVIAIFPPEGLGPGVADIDVKPRASLVL